MDDHVATSLQRQLWLCYLTQSSDVVEVETHNEAQVDNLWH